MNQNHFLRKIAINLTSIIAFCFISVTAYCESEEREISEFSEISYFLPGNMILKQGSSVSLKLEGNQDDLDKIITKVVDGNLKIYTKNHTTKLGDVKIYVTFVELGAISIAGSGDVYFTTPLNAEEIEMNVSGSGIIKCPELRAEEVELNLAGSGDITVGGSKVEEMEINIAGSGGVDASDLEASEVEVNIAGSGSVKVYVSGELETNIVGSGDVYYKGNPVIDAETTGSGRTKPL
ncbi:MAG: DUF2807 domain-containing protein [Bacteroidales bacterium]|nr:DUF2807 domain-containing protein [Bacteroidales bacterium]